MSRYSYSDDNSYTVHFYVLEDAVPVPRMPELVRAKFLCNSNRSVPVNPSRSEDYRRLGDNPNDPHTFCKRCKRAA